MMNQTIGFAAPLAIGGMTSPASPPKPRHTTSFPTTCRASVPARFSGQPSQWLGACVAGKAQGLGVLRIGARQPFAFLVGRMKEGRPASGLVFNTDKSYAAARGFDAHGRILVADGYHLKKQDAVWADAVRAARSVGDRFAKAGNAGSAAYYRRFASEIENGRPE